MGIKGSVPHSDTYYRNREAGESLAAYTVVYMDGILIRKADPLDPDKMPGAGLIQAAADQGRMANVWYRGIITNSDWNLTSGGRLFLMSGGVIGHDLPETSGFIVQLLGEALTQTTIHFDPEDTTFTIGA